MPLSWPAFEAGVLASQKSAEDWVAELSAKVSRLKDEDQKKAAVAIARASGDVVKLAQLNQWANGLLERGEQR
jgi:hypothetical protein